MLKLIKAFKIIGLKIMKLQNADCKILIIRLMKNLFLTNKHQKYRKKNRKGIGGEAAYSFS